MSDDAFNEVQLSGKQLAFLFMAWAAVSVVIFLLGVMVGRGVRDVSGGAPAPVVETTQTQAADAVASSGATAPPTKPSASNDDYYKMLTGDASKPVDPPVAAAEMAPASAASGAPPPAAPPGRSVTTPPTDSAAGAKSPGNTPATAAQPAKPDGAKPSGNYVVQVTSLNSKDNADAIVAALKTKGFDAFLLTLSPGTPVRFRVRVGPFTQRADADRVKAQLEKIGYKPLVSKG